MPDLKLDRRAVMAGGALLTAGLSTVSSAATPPAARPGRTFTTQPLPCRPSTLTDRLP
jgi:hypothetical protein